MWLRTEPPHDTDTAQGQKVATAPKAPPQGLAKAQDKVLPRPHSRSPRPRQSRQTGYTLKPSAPTALGGGQAAGARQLPWSRRRSAQGGARHTRAFALSGRGLSGTRADWAFAFGPQSLLRCQSPQPGPGASSRPWLRDSAWAWGWGWASFKSSPRLLEAQPGGVLLGPPHSGPLRVLSAPQSSTSSELRSPERRPHRDLSSQDSPATGLGVPGQGHLATSGLAATTSPQDRPSPSLQG